MDLVQVESEAMCIPCCTSSACGARSTARPARACRQAAPCWATTSTASSHPASSHRPNRGACGKGQDCVGQSCTRHVEVSAVSQGVLHQIVAPSGCNKPAIVLLVFARLVGVGINDERAIPGAVRQQSNATLAGTPVAAC